jgi:MFS transporter, DHA1 family, inner membrane transport protein
MAREQPGDGGNLAQTPRTIAVLLVLLTFFAWDRIVLAVSLTEISQAIGLSKPQTGLIATAFTAGLALVALPTGILVKRFGFRPALVGGSLLFSAATFYPPLAHGFADLLASRILVGLGEGVFHVSVLLYLANLSVKHRALLIGSASSVYGLAASVGPPTIQSFNTAMGNWQTSFFVLAAMGMVMCLPLILFVPATAGRQTEASAHPQPIDWNNVLRFWPLLLIIAAQGMTVYSVAGLLPTWLRDYYGFTGSQAAWALGAYGLGAMTGGAPMGFVADRVERRPYLIVMALVTLASVITLMTVDFGFVFTIATAFVFGTFAHSLYVTSIALAQERAGADSAVLVGLIATTFYGFASISGLVLMSVTKYLGHPTGALLLYGIVYAVGLGSFLLFGSEASTRRVNCLDRNLSDDGATKPDKRVECIEG